MNAGRKPVDADRVEEIATDALDTGIVSPDQCPAEECGLKGHRKVRKNRSELDDCMKYGKNLQNPLDRSLGERVILPLEYVIRDRPSNKTIAFRREETCKRARINE